jgi:hypothetical protein
MPPKQTEKKTMVKSSKLTQGEKKKLKNDNKAKANPDKAAAKKEKNDSKRERRYVTCIPSFLEQLQLCLCRCDILIYDAMITSVIMTLTHAFPFFLFVYLLSAESGSVKKLG